MALDLARINDIVVEHLRARGTELGSTLGILLRRQDSSFRPSDLGFTSLSDLLRTAVDGIVVVGRSGVDVVWALGEDLDDRALSQALMDDGVALQGVANAKADFLQWVGIEGFRSCLNTRLEVDDLTLLVGANGVGKTTLLLAASYACQIREGRIRALFSGPRDLRRIRHADYEGPVRLSLHAKSGAELSLTGTVGPDDVSFVLRHRKTTSGPSREWAFPPPPGQPPVSPSPVEGLTWPAVFLRLRSDALASPAPIEDQRPRLDFDGQGLPAVLAFLATNEPDRLDHIVERVRGLVPRVKRVRMPLRRDDRPRLASRGNWDSAESPPVNAPDTRFLYSLEVDIEGSGWIPADMVSEGTLFAFGIHTVLAQPNPPKILFLDDIDRGLHPHAQRTLIQQISTVAAQGTRIVASTHSPYVLDEVPAETVRVVRSAPAEGTTCRRLTAHPEWHEWQASMKAGEFWAYVGEEWLEEGT